MKKIFEGIVYFIGLSCIGLGVNISVHTGLGGSTWDALSFTIASVSRFTPGDMVFIFGVILTISINIINYKTFEKKTPFLMLITILSGYIVGLNIDMWEPLITSITDKYLHIPILLQISGILGIITTGFGIALYSRTNFPVDPIDNFMVQLHKHQNLSLTQARYITDFIALALIFVSAFVIYLIQDIVVLGYLGFGTLIVFMLLSPVIGFFAKRLVKVEVFFSSKKS